MGQDFSLPPPKTRQRETVETEAGKVVLDIWSLLDIIWILFTY